MKKQADVICIGEVLLDFIGLKSAASLVETNQFERHLGGSPTNVAMNLSGLGLEVALIASVGRDSFGTFILKELQAGGIDTKTISETEKPTTIIAVSKTTETPDFLPYRAADTQIFENKISVSLLQKAKIFHTTCFALSENPARTTILKSAKKAHTEGCQISIDINYAEKIWPDKIEAIETLKNYCALQTWVKVSQDDMDRIFGNGLSHQEIFDTLHQWGAALICLTLGKEGAKISEPQKPIIKKEALAITTIADATGAGDAFWSGFLFGKIQGFQNEKALEIALKMASLKLKKVGRITDFSEITSNL